MSAFPPAGPFGEIESPRPLRAHGGTVDLTGWCLDETAQPPAVRLVTAVGTLAATGGLARPDLGAQLPDRPEAARAGFRIEGHLPPGVHAGRFEARRPDGSWQVFREYCLAAEAPGLVAAIESPDTTEPVRRRQHVAGWALHPTQVVSSLSLRYGHQDIPCAHDRARRDVPRRFPQAPQAATCGFQSETILGAGRGPLRLRARLADGSTAIARTGVTIDIAEDENHPPGFDFGATRIPLPGYARRTVPPPARTPRPEHILFVLPGSFASNSALHVAALANELAAAGHTCAVAVAHDVETLSHYERPAFRGVTYADAAAGRIFADGTPPSVIHAWTTRENVRQLVTTLLARHRCRLLVHLEDNEPQLLAVTLGRPPAELAALPDAELDRLVPPDLSHPRRARDFLAAADGVTVITERLREFVPPGRPSEVLWPAADARYFFPRPVPTEFRAALHLPPDGLVLAYHGNVHASNAAEMRELYAAVARLNEGGCPVTLLRAGLDRADFLGPWAARARAHVLELGQILLHRQVPPLLALADVFVQPGAPDAFNDYRFPSKLPEFFALGRPVVLPRTNLGLHVRPGVDALVLERADAAGITAAVRELHRDPALRERLGRGAAAFAEKHFSWARSAEKLARFLASLPASRP